ncbi:MAG: hypothetical protein H6644_17785 [Caldilineaceae bacterium]|nr:hypothetical protein [Caldilineaceae bacterium]
MTILLGALPPTAVHAAAPPVDVATPVVKLKAGTIAPGQEIVTAAGLTIDGYAPDEVGLYIVQFVGPVQADWRAQLAALDVDILGYLPDYAFSVRMTPAQAAQVATWDFVNLVAIFQPAYKLDPDLRRDGPHLYLVHIAPDVDAAQATAAMAASGTTVLQQQGTSVRVLADSAQLPAGVPCGDVDRELNLAESHNEYGAA